MKDLLILSMQFFAEEEPNPVDDGPDSVVENPEPAEDTDEVPEDGVELDGEAGEPEVEPEEPEQEPAKPAQSAEDNRKFANYRRQLEQAQREAQALREEAQALRYEAARAKEYREVLSRFYGYQGDDDEVISHLVAQSNQMTPEQYKAQRDAQRMEIERAIQNDPRVRMAQELSERMAVQAAMQRDFAAIKAAFPDDPGTDMNTIHGSGEVARLICSGVDPVKAYRAVNFEILVEKKAAAAKRTAENKKGKEHLVPTGGTAGGAGGKEIPKDLLALYRDTWPDETDAQLRQRYNNVLKLQGE